MLTGLDAARINDHWATQEGPAPAETANAVVGNGTKSPFGDGLKWDLLPHRNGGTNIKNGTTNGGGDDHNVTNGSGAEGNRDIPKSGGSEAAAGKEPGNNVGGSNISKPPSPLDAFKLPADLETGGSFGGLPAAGAQVLSAAAAGGFGDAAGHSFSL